MPLYNLPHMLDGRSGIALVFLRLLVALICKKNS
jgi:hypothetical protein